MSDHALALWGFILAIVAILVAMPSVLQAIFGRPKVTIRFFREQDQESTLFVIITCPPVTNRLLLFFGVVRVEAAISGSFQLTDAVGNEIASGDQYFQTDTSEHLSHVSIRGGERAYAVAAKWYYTENYASPGHWEAGPNVNPDDYTRIEYGTYQYALFLSASGRSMPLMRTFQFSSSGIDWMPNDETRSDI